MRLDAAVAARGLARSRTQAAGLIHQGRVSVDGIAALKPSARVAPDSRVEVTAADHYVSRAAHKLIAALDGFAIDPSGRTCLDLGASTGGFTQVLRERAAATVIAVDVGHGQLAAEVAADPAVISLEGVNARYLTPDELRRISGIPTAPDLVTGDLSFISLTHILPAVAETVADTGDVVLLIKPQFEVGRTGIREGVVTDPGLRADAVAGVLWAAWDAGLGVHGLIASPIAGTHGNAEYLAHLRRRDPAGAGNPTQWLSTVNELAGTR